MAAYSAILRGAAEVYVVDGVAERLAKAEEIGAIGIDYTQGEPCKQIFELRKKNPLVRGSLRPGEEKMSGVMCGIDAVGYQARRFDRPDEENPMQVIEELVHVVNPTGRIGIVGVYFPADPGGVDKHAKQGEFQLPLGAIFEKGLSIGTGQTPVKKYNAYLRDLDRRRPGQAQLHREPPVDAGGGPGRLREVRPAQRRVHQGGPQARGERPRLARRFVVARPLRCRGLLATPSRRVGPNKSSPAARGPGLSRVDKGKLVRRFADSAKEGGASKRESPVGPRAAAVAAAGGR